MARLSAVLIVQDEAHNLEKCLQGLAFADEIVVLDSGSSDNTLEIARRHGAIVEQNIDWQGFGMQRQRAQSLASGDWILMVDADERVSPALREEIVSAIAQDDRAVAYRIPRLSWVFGRFIRHSGWYPDYVLRLYPADHGRYNDALVHERVTLDEGIRTADLQQPLLHFTYRDLHSYLYKSADYARAWAAQRERQGRKGSLSQGIFHAIGCFVRMYLVKAGFLDGRQGLLLALLSAHSTFVKYADLWARRQVDPPENAG